MKKGYQTTEFWVTVVVQIVGLMAAAGVFTTEQAAQWQRVAEMAGGLIAMVVSNIAYAQSRGKVKAAESAKSVDCKPIDRQAGSARLIVTTAILGAAMLVLFASCASTLKPVSEMTPKEKAVFFMSVYSDQAENYKKLASDETLTESQKIILRSKKQLLSEVYPLISLYSDYVEAGAVPDRAVENQIIDYLDLLSKTVTEG